MEEHELHTRILMLKNQGKTIGFKAMSREYKMTPEQLTTLDQIRKDIKNRNWDELFRLDNKGDDYREVVKLTMQAFQQTKAILDNMHEDSFLYNSIQKVYQIFVQ